MAETHAAVVSDLTVTVDGSGSTDADGTVSAWAWDFGDGGTATGAKPAPHIYTTAGEKVITLTVTDDRGAKHTTTKTVTPVVANVAPNAAFAAVVSDLTVTVDGSGSTDADGTVSAWAWDFGDGGTATGAKPAPHIDTTAGEKVITLTVTDDPVVPSTPSPRR